MKSNPAIHLLPGRMRVKIPGLRGNVQMSQSLNKTLSNLPGILGRQVNSQTGSVLVFYNPIQIDHLTIILLLDAKKREHTNPVNLVQLPPRFSTEWPTVHVLLIGSAILGLMIKHRFLDHSYSRSNRGVELALFVSILSGYPIFTKELERLSQPLSFSFRTVLDTMSLSFLFFKDSMKGLFISLLFSFAKLVGEVNSLKSQQVIGKLDLWPRQVRILQKAGITSIPSQQISPGHILIIYSGEAIYVDGVVLSGKADVDESGITGFPDLIQKAPGESVLAGSIVHSGTLLVQARKVGPNTYVQELMEKSIEHGSVKDIDTIRAQKRINRLTFLSLLLSGINYLLTRDSTRSLTMLLAALPSAAGLALPSCHGFTIGKAARQKIYFKGHGFLERAAHIDVVAFDKTGTLSTSNLHVEEINSLDRNYSKAELIRLALSSEGSIRLPLANAIRNVALEMNIRPLSPAQSVEVTRSIGVQTQIKEKNILIGTKSFMIDAKIPLDKAHSKFNRFRHLGFSPVFIAVDKKLVGLLAVRESLKPEARKTIEALRALGIKKFILLTGDSQESALMAGEELGITESYGELNPYEKAAYIRSFREQGYSIAMVGDGLDDGIAMKEGSLGICLGSKGLDSSARVAEIVIASHDPLKLVELFQLAQQSEEISEQNLSLSLGLNFIGLGLGAAGFITPVSAGLLNNVGIFAVLLNSMTI